jgi:hypothetical protein
MVYILVLVVVVSELSAVLFSLANIISCIDNLLLDPLSHTTVKDPCIEYIVYSFLTILIRTLRLSIYHIPGFISLDCILGVNGKQFCNLITVNATIGPPYPRQITTMTDYLLVSTLYVFCRS